MPLPNTCNVRDPGDWSRFCCETPDHDGPHGYSASEYRDGISRITRVQWEPTDPAPSRVVDAGTRDPIS